MQSSQCQTAPDRCSGLGLVLALAFAIAPLTNALAGEAERALFDKLATMDWQVREDASDDPAFCRQYLDDIKHHPDRIEFIEPVVDTDAWTDPKLQELVGHCGRKDLLAGEILRKGAGTGRFLYYDKRLALWPLPTRNAASEGTYVLLFRGPVYRLEPDPREYVSPTERDEFAQRYIRLGSYLILNTKTCHVTKSFSIPGKYEGMRQGPRPVSYVRYRDERLIHVNGRLTGNASVLWMFIHRMHGAEITGSCAIITDNLDEQGG